MKLSIIVALIISTGCMPAAKEKPKPKPLAEYCEEIDAEPKRATWKEYAVTRCDAKRDYAVSFENVIECLEFKSQLQRANVEGDYDVGDHCARDLIVTRSW